MCIGDQEEKSIEHQILNWVFKMDDTIIFSRRTDYSINQIMAAVFDNQPLVIDDIYPWDVPVQPSQVLLINAFISGYRQTMIAAGFGDYAKQEWLDKFNEGRRQRYLRVLSKSEAVTNDY